MLEKGKELLLKTGETLLDKVNELHDPKEIGKCVCTALCCVCVGYSTKVICEHGGINYNNKLFIGVSNKNL